MIKTIIVDDEPYVRQMIRSMIHWEALSLELVGEYFNGEDAYHAIREDPNIDLVITDLTMPVMDGLELIKSSLAYRQELNFIVISAYDDFHLVKNAFMLGAKDYLLKSEMTQEQLRQVLGSLRLQERNGLAVKTKADQLDMEMVRENLISRLVAGNIQPTELNTLRELLGKHKRKRLVLISMKLIKMDRNIPEPKSSCKKELSECLRSTEKRLVNRDVIHYEVIQTSLYEYVTLLLYSHQESDTAIMNHQKETYRHFSLPGYHVNMGISSTGVDFSKLPQLMSEAEISQNYCFIAGNGSIIRYRTDFKKSSLMEMDIVKQTSNLKKLLSSILFDNSKAGLDGILVLPQSVSANQIQMIQDLYMKYHFIVIDFALQNGLFNEIKHLSHAYEQHLKWYGDLSSLNDWLASVMAAFRSSKGDHSIINQVKHYMEQNYGGDVNLQSVAHKFSINSSYLSRLFSEKENITFVDYLAKVRITRAIELIKTSNLKIYEICSEVGYTSPEHFSRMFKKITGKSPKQFMDGRTI